MMKKLHQNGQSLIEVLIALVIVAVLSSALIVAIVTGMKNSQFAQKQTQATKYAQDAMDKIRTIRDRNNNVRHALLFPTGDYTATFSALWSANMDVICSGPCYFNIEQDVDGEDMLTEDTGWPYFEELGEGLSRQIFLEDTDTGSDRVVDDHLTEKRITVKVKWTDITGDHESYLQTTLTKHQ